MRVRICTSHERPAIYRSKHRIKLLLPYKRLPIPPPHNTCLSRLSDKVLHSCTEWDRNGRRRTCNLALVVFKRILAALPLSYVPLMPVFPGCHSVFIRTLLRYLTLPLRHAPTCHGNGREPEAFSLLSHATYCIRLTLAGFSHPYGWAIRRIDSLLNRKARRNGENRTHVGSL